MGKDERSGGANEATLIRLVYCFCQGISIAVTARNTGLSQKTVRKHYLALRALLLRPAFNRWHGTNTRLLTLETPEQELTGGEILPVFTGRGNRLQAAIFSCLERV